MVQKRKVSKRFVFNILLAVFTWICYGSAFVAPNQFWLAGFLGMLIPLCLLLHFFMAFHWFLNKAWLRLLLSMIVILMGLPFIKGTVAFNFLNFLPADLPSQKTFSVLSYNVRVFNVYSHPQGKDSLGAKGVIAWVNQDSSDIKCFQEFYNEDESEMFNIITQMRNKGYYYKLTPHRSATKKHFFGMATFSKFPIIKSGQVTFKNSANHMLYTDVLIARRDTVRVYNVHLQSMSIDEERLLKDEGFTDAQKTYGDVFTRLKKGFIQRSEQIKMLEEHFQQCPYPIIVCGDFNEMPYGYVYQRMKKYFQNAFEEAGLGFDFSYNGRLFFLRIDNQFFRAPLQVQHFSTNRQVSFTDHFPLQAVYTLP